MEVNMGIVISMIVNDSFAVDINAAITSEWIAYQTVLSSPLNNEIRGRGRPRLDPRDQARRLSHRSALSNHAFEPSLFEPFEAVFGPLSLP